MFTIDKLSRTPIYEQLIARWREKGVHVETGIFRTDMKVSLVNDGPVTICIDTKNKE